MRVFSTNFARSQDKRADCLFPTTYNRVEYVEEMSTLITILIILIYVGVIALSEMFRRDKRTPDEKFEEFVLNWHPPHTKRVIPLCEYQEWHDDTMRCMKGMYETACERMAKGNMSETIIRGFMANIPEIDLNRYPKKRICFLCKEERREEKIKQQYVNEEYGFSESFVEELMVYSIMQGYDWENIVKYRDYWEKYNGPVLQSSLLTDNND